jgi:WhiB family redox-sensing transcriptional regulator
VPAGAARDHVALLSSQGMGLSTVARHSGVSSGVLAKLVSGAPSQKVRRDTLERLLAVCPDGAGRMPTAAAQAHGQAATVGPAVPSPSAAETPAATTAGPGDNSLRPRTAAVPVPGHDTPSVAAAAGPSPRPQPRGVTSKRAAAGTGGPRTRDRADGHRSMSSAQARAADLAALQLSLAQVLEARIDQRAWRAAAACVGLPARMFFAGRGDSRQVRAAKAVCGSCEVRSQCLEANLGQRDGIWGGLTPGERAALRARRAATMTPPPPGPRRPAAGAERTRRYRGGRVSAPLVPCPDCGGRFVAGRGLTRHRRTCPGLWEGAGVAGSGAIG